MVNWKSVESLHRLVAAIIAANPSNKLDYNAIAAIFGQSATYDSIEGQCRKYRKMADELRAEAERQGVSLAKIPRGRQTGTPQTPRGPRNGITKSATPSTGKGRKSAAKGLSTPTKRGVRNLAGDNLTDAIFIENDDDDDDDNADVKVKTEVSIDIPSIEGPGFEPPVANSNDAIASAVFPIKQEDDVTISYMGQATRSRRSAVPSKGSDGDEYMGLRDGSPSIGRGRPLSRRPSAFMATRRNAEYSAESTDEEFA
ncbi:hypothetical protein BDW62DRAFT_219194 [Aspergillus aurantiobrunneus]